MFKKLIILLFTTVCLASATPLQTLEQLSQATIAAIDANRAKPAAQQAKPDLIVRKVLSPYIDYEDMSRWVAGREGWSRASASERAEFTQTFSELLIRTYSSSLNQYQGQEIKYFPPREDISKMERVQIMSHITDKTGQVIRLGYRMVQRDNSWKIYDVVIEGVSLLKGFQSQFSEDIRQNGLAFATKKIRNHLKEIEA